ncbi:hypothetical protein QYE76_031960 [Lolium multiflorum]|uniref:RNase H type-1 domain-containing protein n=1 Tax=Lolium multiflorum TaxID=4521 RepID=A0AAD8QT50_LOLMU|nr:hypothetical protein QYE76_031960 [Lolium multiflorum]
MTPTHPYTTYPSSCELPPSRRAKKSFPSPSFFSRRTGGQVDPRLYRKGKTSAVGAMERKATTHVGSWLSLSCVPSPAKQVGTSRFRAEAMGNENSAPPAAGAWPDLQHKKRNATAELGRDRPGAETAAPLLKWMQNGANEAADETSVPLLKWIKNDPDEAVVKTMVLPPSSENLLKHKATGQLGGTLFKQKLPKSISKDLNAGRRGKISLVMESEGLTVEGRSNPVKLSIVPIGGIHIFIGETVDSDGSPAGAAPQEDGAGPVQVEAPENAAPDQQEAVGESGSPVEESILGNLSPISGDTQSMDTEEFDRKVKEYGYGAQPEVDSAQPKQVLATIAALGEHGSEAADTQSDPQPSRRGSPMSRERPRRDPTPEDHLSTEDMIAQAAMDAAYPLDVLNTPITPDDVEALEAKRLELLATAKKIKNTAAAILEERKDAEIFVSGYIQREKEVDEGLVKVKELRKHWEDKIVEAHHEVEKLRRDMITPRRITFATPTGQQPLATPKDNMTKAAELLKKKDEEIDIDFVRKLVASAVQQQSKADTSRRLASNPDICVSTAQKDAPGDQHRDDESRTGSTERRREAREHPNPIPVPSDSTPRDPARDSRRDAGSRDRNRERTLEQLRGRNQNREQEPRRSQERDPEPRRSQGRDPEPRRSRNEERDPEPRRSGTTRAASATAKAATGAGASTGRTGESMKAEAGGPARIWLSDLEKNTIFCWFDLKTAFEKHFRGTYKRPATASDLQACIQKKGESSRNFLTRWLACRNECENVDHTTAMYAFIGGLQRGGLLRHKLTCLANANKLTLDEMISIASDHLYADDAQAVISRHSNPLTPTKEESRRKRTRPWWRSRQGSASEGYEATAGGSRAPQTYEEYRDMPCLAHLDPVTGKSTHTRNCKWVNDLKNDPEAGYKRARKHRPRGKGGKGKNKDKDEDSSEAMEEDDNSPDPKSGTAGKSNPFDKKSVGAYHTFLGTPTVRATKSAARILNAIVPAVPQYVRWSEIPCTFDREDHPVIVPKECYALVVSPRIDGYDFSKCLMDGGASLNIMYLETLERMNLTKEQLKHSTTEFHGVVPGKKANSLGSITLPVAFGDVHNFREERITFEVVPFKSSYHVIFGRPTYHKFHARACYIYNKLKIPGPKGATYQRTMQRCLKDQIGRNVHAYVDDIAVMTRKGSDLISDLTETFENLRRYKMMLNPLKCVFGVPAGKLLGFIVSNRGIEVNPEKIKAILCIKRPTCLKDVQRLTGCVQQSAGSLAVLARRHFPCTELLKKTDKFVWDEAADAALQGLKEILTSPPILAAPGESEPMLLYLAATNRVISLVIVVERQEEGRTAKWGIELSAFDITYKARTAVKSQVLADFVADWTEAPDASLEPEPETWVMHFDGSKQHQGSGAGVTLKSPTGEELQYVLQIHFEATNNMAEYEALLHGLRIAKEIGIKHIICCGDSDLVAQQVAGTWNARNSVMAAYRDEVDEIAKCFLGYEVKYVRRDDNTAADMLSKLGSGRKPIPPGIFLEHLRIPSVKGANPENPEVAVSPAKEVMAIIPAWTQPFLDYLIDQKLPEDEESSHALKNRCDEQPELGLNWTLSCGVCEPPLTGDLVLRLRQVKDHKLQSPWEGPFVVSKVLHNGSYYLVDFRELRDRPANWRRKRKREDPDDIYDETDRPWNIAQLRPFHT